MSGNIWLEASKLVGITQLPVVVAGRQTRGVEIDPLYVDTAIRRWERWTGEEARLDGVGDTFAEIGAYRAGGDQ